MVALSFQRITYKEVPSQFQENIKILKTQVQIRVRESGRMAVS